jgi:hypothetical protein
VLVSEESRNAGMEQSVGLATMALRAMRRAGFKYGEK